jgi:hypothetical protein
VVVVSSGRIIFLGCWLSRSSAVPARIGHFGLRPSFRPTEKSRERIYSSCSTGKRGSNRIRD